MRLGQMNYFRKLLREFDASARLHCMRGSYPPDEWKEIDEFYKSSKTKVLKYVKECKRDNW